ncbi:MAG TPA: penicillin acylase family protein [Microscillaceae bacterium]|nr:penicillin acylase family protein [Microscillaceae bacterium]
MKYIKRALLIFILLIVIIVIGGYIYLNQSNKYQVDGTITLTGISGDITVYRDKKGMPYIYADSYLDLLKAQGFVTAQDRLFQMQLTRMFAEGRLTELAGEAAKPLDIRARTMGYARNARKHAKLLNKETREFMQTYIDGVNAFIKRGENIPLEFKLAGIKPDLWTIENSLAIMYYMGWGTGANLKTEVIAHLLIEKFGLEKFKTLYPINTNLDALDRLPDSLAFRPSIPDTSEARDSSKITLKTTQGEPLMAFAKDDFYRMTWGSNNWTVSGELSASGKPMMASDPHLDARILPGVMHAVGLFTGDTRAVGVTVPGVPGLLIGRSKYLSNGLTNGYLDVKDLYIETVDPTNAQNYLEGKKSIPFEKVVETLKIKDKAAPGGFKEEQIIVRKTKRGIVISDHLPELKTKQTLVLRWAAYENMGESIGIDFLLKAKSVKEAREYIKNVTIITNNFTLADVNGNIAWYTTGRVPKRKPGVGRIPYKVTNSEDTWLSIIPFDSLPHKDPQTTGWIGNANHNTIPASYPHYISNYYSPYYRYARLKQLMASKPKFTVDDHWQFQRDDYNVLAQKITPTFVKALKKNKETKAMADVLGKWDFHQKIESVGATIFQNIYRILPQKIYKDEMGEELTMFMLDTWYFWQERVEKMLLENKASWIDNIQTKDKKETIEDLIIQAALQTKEELTQKYGADINNWTWGKDHQIAYTNPIRRNGVGKDWLGMAPQPMAGSGETLYRSLYTYGKPQEISFSACLRMVADMGDQEKVLAVINGGIAARTFHPHQKNQIDAYLSGQKLYWWFSDQKIKENAQTKLTLKK